MSDLKISQLTSVGSLAPSDEFAVASGSFTRKATAAQVGAYALTVVNALKGVANGFASLDASALVPLAQLPLSPEFNTAVFGVSSERRIVPRCVHMQSGTTYNLSAADPVGLVRAFFNSSAATGIPATLSPGVSGYIDTRPVGQAMALLGREYIELVHLGSGVWATVRQRMEWQSFTPVWEGKSNAFSAQPSYLCSRFVWRREGLDMRIACSFVRVPASSGSVSPAQQYFMRLPMPLTAAAPRSDFVAQYNPPGYTSYLVYGPHVGHANAGVLWSNIGDGAVVLCRNDALTQWGITAWWSTTQQWGSHGSGYAVATSYSGSAPMSVSVEARVPMQGW